MSDPRSILSRALLFAALTGTPATPATAAAADAAGAAPAVNPAPAASITLPPGGQDAYT
jgi:hypothetical protein